MSIIEIPCPHNYHNNNVPASFIRKRVDVEIRFRIIERFIIHLADGAAPSLTTVNNGDVISRSGIHPGCPDCKASLTSFYLAHSQPSEDCSTLLNVIADRLTYSQLHHHHHLKFPVDVEFVIDHHRLHVNDDDDDDEEEDDDDDEVEEVPLRLKPAIDEAIHALERITLSTSEEAATTTSTTSVCAICLEDLTKNNSINNEDEEAVGRRLPCKHEFHEDCIIEWLHTSHYCPLCRFELPAYTS